MKKVPRGNRSDPPEFYRDPKMLSETRQPDRVSSSCMGYFHFPAIWLDGEPTNDSHALELVQKNVLPNGITINAFRNGFFVFDFRGSDYGRQVHVPGYTYPGPNIPYRHPKATEEAERHANRSTIERTRLINVHQCLFLQAELDVSGSSAAAGFPVSPRDLTRNIFVEGCIDCRPHSDNLHSIARSFFDSESQSEKKQTRRLVEKEVADRAANLLESVIDADGSRAISLIDQLFVAQTHCQESRSGIALVAIWTVIEHFMLVDWTRVLGKQGVSNNRKNKLKGRDFTSSIQLEVLELMGVYDTELFKAIDISRKARNKWMHELEEPSDSDLNHIAFAVRKLLERHYGFDLQYHVHNYSGVDALWNVWLDENFAQSSRAIS